jgi:hypothetical protein
MQLTAKRMQVLPNQKFFSVLSFAIATTQTVTKILKTKAP